MNSDSWAQDDLIPVNLNSTDSKEKKLAQKTNATQKESNVGYGEDHNFGNSKRKCKIFIKEDDINKLDKQVKKDMNAAKEDSKVKKEEAKKNRDSRIEALSKYQLKITKLLEGDDQNPSVQSQIENKLNTLKEKIISTVDDSNNKITNLVNQDYNNKIQNIIDEHHNKIKPIIEKFNKYENFADISQEFNDLIENTTQSESLENINQAVNQAQNDNQMYPALKKIDEIVAESLKECTQEACPANTLKDKIDYIIGTSDIIKNINIAIKDNTSKSNYSNLKENQIMNRLRDLKFDLDEKLEKVKINVEENNTIFSKRRAKTNEIVNSLKSSIENLTNNSDKKISEAKGELLNNIKVIVETRNQSLKTMIKDESNQLNKMLKDLDNQSNQINKDKENEEKEIEKEYNMKIKNIDTEESKLLKGYKYDLENPIDIVLYYKSMTQGLMGKKSGHYKGKLLGIKNYTSMMGANSLVAVYQEEDSKTEKTTELTNVCSLK